MKEGYTQGKAISTVYDMQNDKERLYLAIRLDKYKEEDINAMKKFIKLCADGVIARKTISEINSFLDVSNYRDAWTICRSYNHETKKEMAKYSSTSGVKKSALTGNGFDAQCKRHKGLLPFVKSYIEDTIKKIKSRLK